MAIANYLQEIKAAGIYRFIFDKSLLPAQQKESIRLVVGYSEKGPFNTPVFVETAADFKKIYGDVSKKLERYGDFFHRSALQALEAGPIFALNVKNFSKPVEGETDAETGEEGSGNGKDYVQGITFDGTGISNDDLKYHVTDIYDKTRFWYLEPKNLRTEDTGYITLAATDSKSVSNTVFIRAYKPKGYDITFKEWYAGVMNGEELPEFFEGHEDEKLEDYFVKIYVFKGQITPALIDTDFYGKYFSVNGGNVLVEDTIDNAFGEPVDALDMFCKSSKSNLVNVYSGIIFPDMVDAKNMPISIDAFFNAENDKHKMMIDLNIEKLYDGEITDVTTLKMISDGAAFTKADYDAPGTWSDEARTAHYIEGYTYSFASPNGTDNDAKKEWQDNILSALKGITKTTTPAGGGDPVTEEIGYKGLRIALTDRKSIAYHYLVDTFKTYLGENVKGIFTNICKEKQNAIALLNFPEIQLFKEFEVDPTEDLESTSKYKYIVNNTVDFNKVVTGGDITLPDEENGAAFCSFNTCLVLQNPVTLTKTIIPSAALVSNCFMDKYKSRLPYSIVAGPNYAKINVKNLVGPDYIFSTEDLYALEPWGVNCMVYEPKKGTYINANQTAKQNPQSALSKLHIMELCIFLQDEIEALLQSYQWEFNDAVLRDTIKKKADVILETAKGNKAIYDYVSQCDEKNNPIEVIENEMLILDYGIEPAYGAGKMVQQLTVYRTGGISQRTLS